MEMIVPGSHLPPLSSGSVLVCTVHVPSVVRWTDCFYALLSASERKRADRFHRAFDRDVSIAARGALRVLLGAYTGIPSSAIEFSYSENGKPFLVSSASCRPCVKEKSPGGSLAFNVSHSGEWVMIAVGWEQNLGIDVEKVRPEVDVISIASRYFAQEESAKIEASANYSETFFRYWTRKEAYVKALGSGLFRELSSFAVPWGENEREGWHFRDLEVSSGYAAALVSDRKVDQILYHDFRAMAGDDGLINRS